ncbi:MAG: Gfo/Idh/MocA family oxidoreductase [Geminicoccaceae bacterium]
MQAVRRVIDEGRIGRPSYARIQHRHKHDIYAGQPYLRSEKRLAVMDVGVHLLDLARFFIGEVENVHARMQTVGSDVVGEDSVVMSLGHADEAVTLVDISFASFRQPDPFPQTLVRIEGDRGTIELAAGYLMRVSSSAGGENFDVSPNAPAWGAAGRGLIEESVVAIQRHWLECLGSGREPATSGRDNIRVLELAERAYREAGR